MPAKLGPIWALLFVPGVLGWVGHTSYGASSRRTRAAPATLSGQEAASAAASPDKAAEAAALARELEAAWQEALESGSGASGAGAKLLRELLAPACKWDGDSESLGGAAVIEKSLAGTGGFFEDAKFAFTSFELASEDAAEEPEQGGGLPFGLQLPKNPFAGDEGADSGTVATETWVAEWTFSGSWPLPWRPRARLCGAALITTTVPDAETGGRKVLSVLDQWRAPSGGLDLINSQVAPRAVDMLNVYSSPHAERVPMAKLGGAKGYDLYEVPAHACLKVTLRLDPAESEWDKENLQGSFLPDHAFWEPLKFRGKYGDEYVTTSPLGVCVEAEAPEAATKATRRLLTWTVPLPTALCPGTDLGSCLAPLPELSGLADDVKSGKVGLEYAVVPKRRLACAAFGAEDTVSDEASKARRDLLDAVRRDGGNVRTSAASGRPKFELLNFETKLGWSPVTKGFHMAVYAATPPLFPKANLIAIELLD